MFLFIFLEWLSHFRIGSHATYEIKFKQADELIETKITIGSDEKMIIEFCDKSKAIASFIRGSNEEAQILLDNEMIKVKFFRASDSLTIWSDKYGRFNLSFKKEDSISSKTDSKSSDNGGKILTTMPCKINQILIKQGDEVKVGTPLCVTEAMKMEVKIQLANIFYRFSL